MIDQRKVIAIVDDDQSMRNAVAKLLNAHGFATQVFPSAEAFLDCGAASQAAVLILDIHLSGMSGLELRQQLTSEGSQLPVIFITGADDDAIRRQATKVGCVACLRKPFQADFLINAIRTAVAE